jgi:hypothetical protein
VKSPFAEVAKISGDATAFADQSFEIDIAVFADREHVESEKLGKRLPGVKFDEAKLVIAQRRR